MLEAKTLGYVYVITNKVNGKKYVGQTVVSIERRWIQHLSAARKGSPYALHGAIRKYGDHSFSVRCCEEVLGAFQEILDAEIKHIQQQGSLYPQGYNLTPGGEGIDWSNPDLRERHQKAIKISSSKESWKKAQKIGASKRTSDPQWQALTLENLQRMHSDPAWQKANRESLQTRHANPAFKARLAEGISKRSDGPWRENHRVAMERMHSDPVFKKKRTDWLTVSGARRSKEAELRDAQCSPDVAARRKRKRELRKLYRERARSRSSHA